MPRTCGTYFLGQEGDPGGIPASTTDSGHLFVVDRVSINVVTILAPVTILGKAQEAVVDSGVEVSKLSSKGIMPFQRMCILSSNPHQFNLWSWIAVDTWRLRVWSS